MIRGRISRSPLAFLKGKFNLVEGEYQALVADEDGIYISRLVVGSGGIVK